MQSPLIEFKQVSKRFGDNVVLDRADLVVYPGQVTTLIGKSGVGKSVTLKLIIGLLSPDSGRILYEGRDMAQMSRRERRQILGKMNYMFQNNALFDSLSVFENIALPLQEWRKLGPRQIKNKVREKIELLDLGDIGEKFPSQISGGMQKRVAMARALVTDPEIVLFDEPTTGLDPLRKNNVLAMITENQKQFGFTSILVSHDVPDVFYISNRVAVLEEGSILFQGSSRELERFEHQVVYDFLNSSQQLKNQILGLKTKRELERHVQQAAQKAPGQEFCLLLLGIENLERVEEQAGHFLAQEIVAAASRSLQWRLQAPWDVLGRYSQDRLLCLLFGKDIQDVNNLGREVLQELQEESFMQGTEHSENCVDFSIYFAVIPGNWQSSLKELARQAGQQEQHRVRLVCASEV
ncbi:MAG: ATP-binding cassette domain-containing protein [Desulfohalobiaceae bacterium]